MWKIDENYKVTFDCLSNIIIKKICPSMVFCSIHHKHWIYNWNTTHKSREQIMVDSNSITKYKSSGPRLHIHTYCGNRSNNKNIHTFNKFKFFHRFKTIIINCLGKDIACILHDSTSETNIKLCILPENKLICLKVISVHTFKYHSLFYMDCYLWSLKQIGTWYNNIFPHICNNASTLRFTECLPFV